ncbi:hypothetical protein [Ruegeria sp.]|uniref:hypothetical protein n=1 Tax=Ruegeria sp. TaxID=1879320 RepID=UPI003C7CF4B0
MIKINIWERSTDEGDKKTLRVPLMVWHELHPITAASYDDCTATTKLFAQATLREYILSPTDYKYEARYVTWKKVKPIAKFIGDNGAVDLEAAEIGKPMKSTS